MEITRHYEWPKPQLDIKSNLFELTFDENDIEIVCDWDYGWAGRGTERMYIPISELKNLITEFEGIKTKILINKDLDNTHDPEIRKSIKEAYTNYQTNNWVDFDDSKYLTSPPEGIEVMVTDGTNYSVAWFLKSGEYVWMETKKDKDYSKPFKKFDIKKWRRIPE